MRIVLFDFFFEPGRPGRSGLSDLVWSWAEHLTALGEEVHIVGPYPGGSAVPDGSTVHSFPVPIIGYRNIVGHALIVLRGWRELRKLGRVDLVHAPEYLSTAILCIVEKRTPIVLTTPGNIFERIANVNHTDWFTTQVYKVAALVSARRCAGIIATSDEMQKWWLWSGASKERVTVIPLGVDVCRFRPVPNARAELGLMERPTILFVGRLQSENGPHLVIEAMSQILNEVPDAVLVMVGAGPELDTLCQRADALCLSDSIEWRGRVNLEELPLWYSAADVFVLPRLSRVTPRVLFEAMACQTAVVSSEVGGITDFVEDSVNGYLVDPHDRRAMARRITELLVHEAERKRIGQSARAYACSELAWPVITRRMYDEVYVPLLSLQHPESIG